MQIFCPVLMITLKIWQPLPYWQNLFHRIFLQYKGSWAWQNFCPAKILLHTVLAATQHMIMVVLESSTRLKN